MPLAYGGGLTTLPQCEQLNRIGVEKFVLGHSALDLELVRSVSNSLGSQALAGCVDVVGQGESARCVTRSGRSLTRLTPLQHGLALQAAGAGEIILQSVDRDGARTGCDLELISSLAHSLDVPLVALGGAGNATHLAQALNAGASAAASGSAFSFIGRLRAVLITYPDPMDMDRILMEMA
jgi:cyclase